ncbi:MAG: ATP-binding cassette domain-containing protein, partial [Lentisphaeria bacterium]|nr:ATP-binding cassette domain-containing protein [Lentisphaeria bacterium]
LSGGEQQRVGLARALINTPKLILADEPTGNLDADSAAIILGLLFDLASKSGSTVVLTTHDPAVAERCVRRIHIEAGRIAQDHTGPQ